MKILYVDANVWHLNPTANLLPLLFRERFAQTSCYGPGFSSHQELAGGLLRYVNETGPYDALVVGSNTPIMGDGAGVVEGAVAYLQRYTAHHLSADHLTVFFQDVRQSLAGLDVPVKLVSALNFDYYATSQRQVDVLLERGLSVLGPNDQFVLPLASLPDFAKREKHYVRKADRFSDVWYDFLCRHPERVVTAVHFVGQQEFFHDSLDARRSDVAVPGVEYLLRKDALKQIAGTRFRQASKAYFHAYRLGNRLGLPVFSNQVLLRLYNLMFQRTLADTRCVYTARGGFGIPIRKFFEIPAAGALLMCSPCNGYEDLGFEPGRHYVAVEPEALPDALMHWLKHPGAQDIARAGQALTLARHSLFARGAQVEQCLRAMGAGRFGGARWVRGEYVVNEGAA